jgi:hypothetical protein
VQMFTRGMMRVEPHFKKHGGAGSGKSCDYCLSIADMGCNAFLDWLG